jgi:hypothetical protein
MHHRTPSSKTGWASVNMVTFPLFCLGRAKDLSAPSIVHRISAPNSCEVVIRTTEGCLAYIKSYNLHRFYSARRLWLIDKNLEATVWEVFQITDIAPVLSSRYSINKKSLS